MHASGQTSKEVSIPERIFTSAWHAALFSIGLWELKNHKTRVGKFFAAGFALWHLDATVADACGKECILKEFLRSIFRRPAR